MSGAVVAAEGPAPQAATIDQAGERRSAQIESLRALAALSVLICHVAFFYFLLGTQGEAFLDPTVLDRVLYAGGYGVALFFALTGYLIFRPFSKRLYSGAPAIPLGTYAVNRLLRILPLYLVVLTVVLAVEERPLSMWVHFFTFTQNFSADTAGQVVAPAWSLAVELQFYVLLPLFALALARFAGDSMRATVGLIVGLGIASLLARVLAVYAPVAPDPTWRYAMVTNFLFFVPGMLLALLDVWLRDRSLRLPPALAGADTWLAGGVTLWAIVALAGEDLDFLICPAAFLIVGACVLPLRAGPVLGSLRFRPLAVLGVASYSLYLWHVPLLELVTNAGASPQLGALAAIAVPAVIAVAFASYRLIEEPFLRLRGRWAS